jgi:hypothetical protein
MNTGTITESYATGNIASNFSVGGLVGYNLGEISYSYARGDVIGERTLGGLVEYNNGTVKRSAGHGNIIGSYYIDGLIGWNWLGNVEGCYATGAVFGIRDVDELIGFDEE